MRSFRVEHIPWGSPERTFNFAPLTSMRRKHRRIGDRHDPDGRRVSYQRGQVEFFEILHLIGLRKRLDAVINGFVTRQHPLPPKRNNQTLVEHDCQAIAAWVFGKTPRRPRQRSELAFVDNFE